MTVRRPEDFWELNAFYAAAESIHAFTVATALGQEEVDSSNELVSAMLDWFDGLNHLIPAWYENHMIGRCDPHRRAAYS